LKYNAKRTGVVQPEEFWHLKKQAVTDLGQMPIFCEGLRQTGSEECALATLPG